MVTGVQTCALPIYPSELPADDNRRRSPRFQGENVDSNRRVLSEIEAVAREKNATPAQIALAWVMAQGPDIIPIPGCKSRRHLEDNLRSTEIELTPPDLARLNMIAPPDRAAGAREQVTAGGFPPQARPQIRG